MRTRRSALSFTSEIGRTGITLLVGLVATPFLLDWLGEARFGAHHAAPDGVGYLIPLELGICGALVPMLARAFGGQDAGEVRATLVAGTRALGRVTLVALALGGALAFFITRLAVASRWGALPEIVGEQGSLIDPRDHARAASTLLALPEHDNAAAAARRAAARFDWSTTSTQTLDVYRRVLGA